MNTLALVMIVKNEERCLEKCLRRVGSLVDEIYITDTGSTDRTVEIAKSFGAHISQYLWKNDFADARNYSLSQSTCDWNLILDADEYLKNGTREELNSFMQCKEQIGAIQLNNFYVESRSQAGEEIGTAYSYIARLFPRGVGFVGKVHEQVDSTLPIRPVPLVFDHDGYLQEGKGKRNLEILYKQYEETPDDPYILYQLAQTLRNLKELRKAYTYYEKFYGIVPVEGTGYRAEGIITFLYTLIDLKEFNRGFEIIQNEKVRLEYNADFHFVCGLFYMQAIRADAQRFIHYLPQIEMSYLRCLEIGEIPLSQGVAGCGSFKAAYNLGTWYEVSGNMRLARQYYERSAKEGYAPALKRLKELKF